MRLDVVVILPIALCAIGCRSTQPADPSDASRVTLTAPAGAHGAHMQIVRPLATKERVALVERFREVNGPAWSITLGAGGAPDDVDAIRGIVRRAKREREAAANAEAGVIGEQAVIDAASAFLAKNADFLAISPRDVPALDVEAGPAKTNAYGSWVVHFRGQIPMRGYEGFIDVVSKIDVLVYVGDDGAPQYFINLSQVHPSLVLDTKPLLGPDDPRLMRLVVGRELFVLLDDPRHPNARPRELRRLPVGRVEPKDVRIVRLIIHVSPALRGAYVSYSLAYEILVVRERHRFRFVVDADTGDWLEDVIPPIVSSPLDETAD
jgi:hypothetical protein